MREDTFSDVTDLSNLAVGMVRQTIRIVLLRDITFQSHLLEEGVHLDVDVKNGNRYLIRGKIQGATQCAPHVKP